MSEEIESTTCGPDEGPRMTRRGLLKAGGLGAGAAAMGGAGTLATAPFAPSAWAAGSDEPLRIGFQVHRTGIGATYGRWYERTAKAAAAWLNQNGGIAGRPVELVAEDDGTDPKRGAEVVEKLATAHGVDFVYGPLFSHVVIGSAPRAGELKIPYFVVSEGYHVASGSLNRYVFQPGITDVRAQVQAMAPWVMGNLGQRVAMMFPDYAFGYDHRDYFSAAVEAHGGSVAAKIAIPPTESSFTKYFPQIPRGHRGALPRHGRTGGADLRQGDGGALRLQSPADLRLHRLAGGRGHREPRPLLPGGDLAVGGDAALRGRSRHRGQPSLPGSGSASTPTGRASTIRRTCRRTRTCSAAGRRST